MQKSGKGRLLAVVLAAALAFAALPETVHAAVGGDDYPAKYKNAAQDSIVDEWRFYNRECTSFAAWCLNSRNGVDFKNSYLGQTWGYANNWGNAARRAGITVDNTPAVGAIWWSSSGHVAWVAEVNGDKVTIEEYNYNYDGKYQYRKNIPASSATGYIHIKDLTVVQPEPSEPERGAEVTGSFPRTISDGDYHIVSALEGDKYKQGTKCLTIGGLPANQNTDQANAELWAVNGQPDHVFTVTWIDETHGYKIKLKNSDNQYLEVYGADTAVGANVNQYEGNGSLAQQWFIHESADGNGYSIQARCSGYYVDVAEGQTADGTNIRLWYGNGGNAQRWYFVPWGGGSSAVQSIPDGAYEIVSKIDSSKVLSTDGTKLALYSRGDDGRHIFQTTYLGQGYYKITNQNTGKVLDAAYADNLRGILILLCDYWDSANEQWLIRDCGGGDYQIVSKCNGLCVDIADAVAAEGQEIHLWSSFDGENQKWKFVPYKQTPADQPDPVDPTPDDPDPNHPAPNQPDTDQGEVLDEDIPEGGIEKIPQGLWMTEIADQSYTGKAVKPAVRVYDHKKLLMEKKDYTISYKNNTKAASASDAKAPTITVAGRGNYNGKETQTFTIRPKSLADEDVFACDTAARYTGRAIKSAPAIVWNGKRLVRNKDYTISYPDGAYMDVGLYRILMTGKGNFSGERTVSFTITRGKTASAFRVTKPENCLYTGKPVTPKLTVKDGKTTLTEGKDYRVTYRNHIQIGTAEAIVTGMGNYAGVKTVSFKILPAASLNRAKAELTFGNGAVYTGNEVRPTACRVTLKGKDAEGNVITVVLTEGEDYEVSYRNDRKAGTATAVFRGINAYSGSLKKTYKIAAYDVAGEQIGVSMESSYDYVKGGCKPEPVVTFRGMTLTKGTDYTLAYKNNTGLSDGSNLRKQPTVIIKGRGCFTGSLEKNYKIVPKDMSALTMKAADKTWQNRKNIYRTKVTIQDVDGRNLSAGRDYDKDLQYEYAADTTLNDGTVRKCGTEINRQDIIPAGTVIRVTASAKGSQYTGQISCSYRITKTDIGRAKVKVPAQTYTGKEIRPDSEIRITLDGQVLSTENYEIIGYRNNINQGTATLTIRGRNDCGGTKTVRFTIRKKGFRWWWR